MKGNARRIASLWALFTLLSATLLAQDARSYAAGLSLFVDTEGYWAQEAIEWAVREGIVTGYEDNTFRPDKPVTQAQFLTMLLRAYSHQSSPDISKNSPWDEPSWRFSEGMNWELGERYAAASRGRIAILIGNSLGYACDENQYIQLLYDRGLSSGKKDKTIAGYAKEEALTRAQAVVFIRNMHGMVEKLQARPSLPSAGCPEVGASSEERSVTKGGYTITSDRTNSSSVTLTGSFTRERDVLVRISKGDKVEKEVYATEGNRLRQPLYFRHGPGQYRIELFERDAGSEEGEFTGVLWGEQAFLVSNEDRRDLSYLLPTPYVQSDHPDIMALSQEITESLVSDYEITKAIHQWVATHIAYDVESFRNGTSQLHTTTEILERGMDVCSGYANITAALNRAAGIPAKIVIGTAIWADQGETWETTIKTDNHAWVETYVDGRWIVQDTTWDAGSVDDDCGCFRFNYDTAYFDPDPDQFAITHRKSRDRNM
ncbi:S-layer homology domain-containing protein [Paenibacillus sp. J5C_2022]|uniref:transglutaminase domain-containing protein n=1 Tax=Paenibacillus sp. J5C2022 TaxID=2977129 RepID=UPI0021D3DE5E|nr:transglutaminase domain-containing protein [Paenibacillus sp. J5C2022]MCU6708391.1 S-layer homology domain-containing protein [Paenibacillus sp. J5C2022]